LIFYGIQAFPKKDWRNLRLLVLSNLSKKIDNNEIGNKGLKTLATINFDKLNWLNLSITFHIRVQNLSMIMVQYIYGKYIGII
jgi:hypothetical protein